MRFTLAVISMLYLSGCQSPGYYINGPQGRDPRPIERMDVPATDKTIQGEIDWANRRLP